MSIRNYDKKAMKPILYILILKDNNAFKVGITNNSDLNRIKSLSGKYEFNLSESYIITADLDKTTKMLERQIHSDYHCYHHEFNHKNDGHTEFIKIEHLNSVLSDIEHKVKLKHLNIEIKKGIDIKPINISQPIVSFGYIDANGVDTFDLLFKNIILFKSKISFVKISLPNLTYPKYALMCDDIDVLKLLLKISKFYYGEPNNLGGYWNYHTIFTNKDYSNESGYLILDDIRGHDDEYYDAVYQPLLSSFYLMLDKEFNNSKLLINKTNNHISKPVVRVNKPKSKKNIKQYNWFKSLDEVTVFDDLLSIIMENKDKFRFEINGELNYVEHRLCYNGNDIDLFKKIYYMSRFEYDRDIVINKYDLTHYHRIFSDCIYHKVIDDRYLNVGFFTIDKIRNDKHNDINLMKYNTMLLNLITVLEKELKSPTLTIYP